MQSALRLSHPHPAIFVHSVLDNPAQLTAKTELVTNVNNSANIYFLILYIMLKKYHGRRNKKIRHTADFFYRCLLC